MYVACLVRVISPMLHSPEASNSGRCLLDMLCPCVYASVHVYICMCVCVCVCVCVNRYDKEDSERRSGAKLRELQEKHWEATLGNPKQRKAEEDMSQAVKVCQRVHGMLCLLAMHGYAYLPRMHNIQAFRPPCVIHPITRDPPQHFYRAGWGSLLCCACVR